MMQLGCHHSYHDLWHALRWHGTGIDSFGHFVPEIRCRARSRLSLRSDLMDRPLSFCMITTFYPPYHFGGEAMYLYRLTNALARRGHKVTVVHCVDSYRLLTSAGPRGSFPHHDNVTVHS